MSAITLLLSLDITGEQKPKTNQPFQKAFNESYKLPLKVKENSVPYSKVLVKPQT